MNKYSIGFVKVREVKDPVRAHRNDAGIDFFLPKIDADFAAALHDKNKHLVRWKEIVCLDPEDGEYYLRLLPGMRILIPSGIKVSIRDKESALVAFNKSGLSATSGITVTAQVVDADYTGEVHVGLINNSDETFVFKEKAKIGQFLHLPIILSNLTELTAAEYKDETSDSDRGEGGFGSTDKR